MGEVIHPHHPLYGQQVEIIRIRRGPDPDLIIRQLDGYHGAIAASWTTYASTAEALSTERPPYSTWKGCISSLVWLSNSRNGVVPLGRIGYDRASDVFIHPQEGIFMAMHSSTADHMVTPAQVWTYLSTDLQVHVIRLLAQLAATWCSPNRRGARSPPTKGDP